MCFWLLYVVCEPEIFGLFTSKRHMREWRRVYDKSWLVRWSLCHSFWQPAGYLDRCWYLCRNFVLLLERKHTNRHEVRICLLFSIFRWFFLAKFTYKSNGNKSLSVWATKLIGKAQTENKKKSSKSNRLNSFGGFFLHFFHLPFHNFSCANLYYDQCVAISFLYGTLWTAATAKPYSSSDFRANELFVNRIALDRNVCLKLLKFRKWAPYC